MKPLVVILTVFSCFISSSFACSRVGNSPYVQSFTGRGFAYARCIPAEREGNNGTTTIYRVGAEADEKLDTYDWYSPEGVTLGWSPIVGKVAVMRMREGIESTEEVVEFSFYLGGQLLRSYTAKEVMDFGIQSGYTSCGKRLSYTVVGVEQMPANTNNYAFVVEFETMKEGKNVKSKLYFDILTGKLVSQ